MSTQKIIAHKNENDEIVVDEVIFQKETTLNVDQLKKLRRQRSRTNRSLERLWMEKDPDSWDEYEAQVRARNGK